MDFVVNRLKIKYILEKMYVCMHVCICVYTPPHTQTYIHTSYLFHTYIHKHSINCLVTKNKELNISFRDFVLKCFIQESAVQWLKKHFHRQKAVLIFNILRKQLCQTDHKLCLDSLRRKLMFGNNSFCAMPKTEALFEPRQTSSEVSTQELNT